MIDPAMVRPGPPRQAAVRRSPHEGERGKTNERGILAAVVREVGVGAFRRVLGSFEGMEEAEEERGGVRASKNGEAGWWSRQRTSRVRWTRLGRMCRLRREESTRRSHKVCGVAREG